MSEKTFKSKFSRETVDRIVDLYVNKMIGSTKISKQTGVSLASVKDILDREGIQARTMEQRVTNRRIRDLEMASIYNKGATSDELAKQFGIDRGTVVAALNRVGVKLKQAWELNIKYSVNHNAFDELTDETCYWIGFLMADGSVHMSHRSGGVSLTLAIIDIDHVESYKNFVGFDGDVKIGESACLGKKFKKASVRFTSPQIADRLQKFGVVPRKSLIAEAKGGMENNIWFWRGVVDGDGALFMDKPRGTCRLPSPIFYLVGSEMIVSQFCRFIESEIEGMQMKPRKCGKNLWCAEKSQRKALQIVHLLYDDARFSLKRKAEKAKEFFEWEHLPRLKGAPVRFTKEDEAWIVEQYNNGVSGKQMCRVYGVCSKRITWVLNKHGITVTQYPKNDPRHIPGRISPIAKRQNT